MSISLFEHNETAYNSALNLFKRRNKSAVIHPTGTGEIHREEAEKQAESEVIEEGVLGMTGDSGAGIEINSVEEFTENVVENTEVENACSDDISNETNPEEETK